MTTGALLSPSSSAHPNLNYSVLHRRDGDDPDTLFTNHGIAEVRRIHTKLKFDVDAKEYELRTMVGERYRELLQASTAILDMNRASQQVMSVLNGAQALCQIRAELVGEDRGSPSAKEDEQLQRLQVLASHVKLLLEAPEHLWRLLEEKLFIQASCLFLVARLIYQALKSHELEDGQPAVIEMNITRDFPIIYRQWELVSQFRAQIVHRSKQALREYDDDILKPTGQLLALHVLENISLKDGLFLLLDNRLKTFTAILSSISSEHSERVEDPWPQKMLQARDVVACTVSAAHAIFVGDSAGLKDGLFMRAVSEMQSDAISQEDTLIPSTNRLMKLLPSSAYLSALPSSIKAYRPIFDPLASVYADSTEDLEAHITSWVELTIGDIRGPLLILFASVDRIQAVWSLRKRLLLDERNHPTFMTLHRLWTQQVNEIAKNQTSTLWQRYLDNMINGFQQSLKEAMAKMTGITNDSDDYQASSFLLCPVSERVNQNFISSSALDTLRKSLHHSLTMFTPQVQYVVQYLEHFAARLSSEIGSIDRLHFRGDFSAHYEQDALQLLGGILEVIESASTKSMGEHDSPHRDGSASRFPLFRGQVSRALVLSSTFLRDLGLPPSEIKELKSSFMLVHERSLQLWQDAFTACQSTTLTNHFQSSLVFIGTKLDDHHIPNQPSPRIFQLCCSFGKNARQFDMDLLSDQHYMIKLLQTAFLMTVYNGLSSFERNSEPGLPALLQIIFDLHFLESIVASCNVASKSEQHRTIASVQHHLKDFTGLGKTRYSEQLQMLQKKMDALMGNIQSSSFLFFPLTSELAPRVAAASKSGLLENSLSSTLKLVKPSSRIAMLHISN